MSRIVPVVSWIISLWICKVFLSSIPYKFSGHPDTQYIFSTIGLWIQDVISVPVGEWFIGYGAIVVGSAELIVSSILLLPAVFFILSLVGIVKNTGYRAYFHGVGGLLASMVMAGAAFFHIATPLGIEVLHNGVSDHGSLFYAALSILVLGLVMALLNFQIIRQNKQ
jgi:hypothetical protein